jgi:putative alpha-1,2-mannosidase
MYKLQLHKPVLFAALIGSALSATAQTKSSEKLVQYVKPIVGTQRMGHVYPGATVPFGAVQLSPETDTVGYVKDGNKYDPDVYKYCAGYQYDDKSIVALRLHIKTKLPKPTTTK